MNEEILHVFFTHLYEEDVHEKLLDDISFSIPVENIKDYIYKLINIPYRDFILFVRDRLNNDLITSKDITQCSSINACTEEMCLVLYDDENRGKNFLEIGKSPIFEKYIKRHNNTAWLKYGENQVKTAQQLGLAFEYYNLWYLSCFGYVYNSLDDMSRKKLLARNLLRAPLYRTIVMQIVDHEVYIQNFMKELSPSTQSRRAGSVMKLIKYCTDEMNNENIKWHNIHFVKYHNNNLTDIIKKGTF